MPAKRRHEIEPIEDDDPRLEFTWGDRVAKARRLAALDQRDIARACAVGHQTVSNWENGNTAPPQTKLLAYAGAISDATGAPMTWLLAVDQNGLEELIERRASSWKCDGCGGTIPGGCKCAGGPAVLASGGPGDSDDGLSFHPVVVGHEMDPALASL